jgi:hypothetical protein
MSEGEKLRRSRLVRLLSASTGALCLLLVFALPSPGNQVPSATSLQALNIGLTEDRQVRLMAGWNSALASGDPSLAIAAINLLEFCPPQLRTRL